MGLKWKGPAWMPDMTIEKWRPNLTARRLEKYARHKEVLWVAGNAMSNGIGNISVTIYSSTWTFLTEPLDLKPRQWRHPNPN